MKLIIENDKDQRIYDWLCKIIGEEAILTAAENLVGKRKPYLSNIVKELNLVVPFEVQHSKKVGIKKLDEIKMILKKTKKI